MNWKLHPIATFSDHRDCWQNLNQCGVASPLLDVAFVEPLLEYFSTGNEVLACYDNGGRCEAMTILTERGHGRWESFQPAQAPLGMWLCAPSLADQHGVVSQLMRALPGFPLVVGILQQDPALLMRPDHALATNTLDYIETPSIQVHGLFDTYWRTRSNNLRQNLRRQRNKLRREGILPRLELSVAPEEVMQVISDFSTLECAGWKNSAGTAVHVKDAQGEFYRSVLTAFSHNRAARMYRYWFDDQLAAMDLYIEGYGAAVLLKTAYDENICHFSPALLMREEIMKQMFSEAHLNVIELYGRYVKWNAQWSTEVRTMYHVNHYRWNFLSYLHLSHQKGSFSTH